MSYHQLVVVAAFFVFGWATPSRAAIIFSQNFETGLGANETTSGAFTRNNTGSSGNGTFFMGHPGTYGNDEYSFYQVQLNLTNYTNSTLQFDFRGQGESHFDRFNLLATSGAITPPNNLLNPTGLSTLLYTNEFDVHSPELGQIAFAFRNSSPLVGIFDLSAFDGQIVNVRFQFGSDSSVTGPGIAIDNVLVQGTVATPTPEPATIVVFGGIAVAGAFGYRRRKAVATA